MTGRIDLVARPRELTTGAGQNTGASDAPAAGRLKDGAD